MANEQSKVLILSVIDSLVTLSDKFYAGMAKWRQPANANQSNTVALAHLSAVWMKSIESAEVLRDNIRRTFAGPNYLADQKRALGPAQDIFENLRSMKSQIIGGTATVRVTQSFASKQFAGMINVAVRDLNLIAGYLQKNEIISPGSKAVIDEKIAGLSERESMSRAA